MINFSGIFVVWFAVRWPQGRAYWLAFLTGMFADLTLGSRLGMSAVFYLVITFLIIFFRRRFQYNRFYLILFLIISQIFFYYARSFT